MYATMCLVIAWHFVNSFFPTGYITASILTFVTIALDIVFLVRHKDPLLNRFFLLALITGWSELWADDWLVSDIQKLVYDPHGPFVLSSPLYMPFAWTAILFQFSYLTWQALQKRSMWFVVAQSAIFGGLVVPLYEHFAYGAGWWYYKDTPMFGRAPYFIILGEVIILAIMPLVLQFIQKRKWYITALVGVAEGLWIFASYWMAYNLLTWYGV